MPARRLGLNSGVHLGKLSEREPVASSIPVVEFPMSTEGQHRNSQPGLRIGLLPHSPFPDYSKIWVGVKQQSLELEPPAECVFLPKRVPLFQIMEQMHLDAVLGHFSSADDIHFVHSTGMPAISVFRGEFSRHPLITHDLVSHAELLLGYLLEKSFQDVCFFSDQSNSHSPELIHTMSTMMEAAGGTLHVFRNGDRTKKRGKWVLQDQLLDLGEWLRPHPKPLAVVCTDPNHAQRIYMVCEACGWKIPEDVVVAACMGSEQQMDFLEPHLTRPITNYVEIGREAVRCMHRILTDQTSPKPDVICVRATALDIQPSTDQNAIQDFIVRKALTIMQEHLAEKCSVNELAQTLRVSRSTLERRFQKVLGKGPATKFRELRAETALRLLTQTDRKMIDIALECGISDPSQFSRFIKETYGCTPLEIRSNR